MLAVWVLWGEGWSLGGLKGTYKIVYLKLFSTKNTLRKLPNFQLVFAENALEVFLKVSYSIF
jgi:hypothetical protein